MKKHMTGFVPINFQKSGWILLTIGIVLILSKLISFATNFYFVPTYLIYIGIAMIAVSLYLIFVSPKEEV